MAAGAAAALVSGIPSGLPSASAATLDWDITPGTVGPGDSAVTGGTGTWDTTTGNFTADGGATNVAWVNANNDTARFGAPAGTVTLGTAITANGLTFNTTGYTVTGSTLTLAGTTPTLTVTNAGDSATVASVLAGTAGLTVAGAGKVTINGANTFTGNITLNGGVLETNMAGGAATSPLGNQIGTTYRQLIFNNNATLRTTASWNDNVPSATNVGIVFNLTGAGTIDVSTGTLTIDDGSGTGTASTNAQLQGSGTLTKIGAGTLSLGNGSSDFSSFTGAIVVGAGTLQLGTGANQFGTTATGTTVQSGGAVNVQANTTAEPFTLSGTGVGNGGALFSSTGTAGAATGAITLAADSSVGGTGNLTLGGVVSGGFNLTKVGTGVLFLNGANTYTGNTTIAAGSLRGVFGTGLPSSTNLILNGGAYEPTANFTGTTGAGAGQIQLPGGTSGFSSGLAAGISVTLDGGATEVWGSANFNPSSLLLNQTTALGPITFTNPIDLNGAARSFTNNSTVAANLATVSGPITSTGGPVAVTINGPTGGGGVIQFTNAGNTGIASLTLSGGELGYSSDAQIGGAATPITFNGGGLQVLGPITDFGAHPVTFTTGKNIQLDINSATNTFTVPSTLALSTGQTLTKVGAGTLVLAAPSNTVTTLNMNGGTLDIGSGTLTLSNNGSTTIRGTANSTLNATGGGSIVLSTGGGSNYGDNSVSSGVTLTINAKVSGVDTTTGFEYCCDNPGGTIVLANPANDFQGQVFVNSPGFISVAAIGNQGAAGPLGLGTTINLNANGGGLRYTGTGETTDRIVNLSGTTSGGTLDQSGTGLLKFITNFTATGGGIKTLTLQGSTVGTGEIAGVIPDNTTTNKTSVTKAGTGTWTLSAANTYTGATTINQGTLAFTTNQGTLGPLNFGSAINTTTTGALDLTNASATFTSSLVQTNSATANTITIGAGKTLALTSGLTLGYDAGSGTGATRSNLTVTGAGAMSVAGTTVNVSVNQAATNAGYFSTGTLDLTGLAGGFTANVTNFNIGVGSTTTGFGNVLLSNTANTLTATTLTVANTGANNGNGTSTLTLGTGTNTIKADTFNIGLGKGSSPGVVKFASQTAGSPGSVTITNAAGTGAANITVGNNNGTATAGGAIGTLDLRGHNATVTAGTLLIGNDNMTSNTGNVTGTVNFDTGTFAVNTLSMGIKTAAGTGQAQGTLNVSGGAFTVNTAFTLGSQASAGSATATLNLTGGTLTSSAAILDGGGTNTSAITLNGGTLDLGGGGTPHAIGGATPIDTLNFQAGTLRNVSEINNGATALTKTTTGTLTLTGTNGYTGGTVVNAGTLLVNSTNATGTGAVTVNSTGILGGTGSIAGPATINTGGTLSPGNSPGTLTFAGPVTFGTGGTAAPPVYLAELQSAAAPVAGTDNDLIALTGSGANGLLTLTNPDTLNLSALTNITGPTTYTIATFASETGVFDNVLVNGQPSQSTNPAGANYALVTYNPNNIQVTVANLTGVPEPASAGLLGLAAVGLLARRRRR